jgi:hypothetical protein
MVRRCLLAVLTLALAAAAPAPAATVAWYASAPTAEPPGRITGAVSGDLNAPAGEWCNVYNVPAACEEQGGTWSLALDAAAPPCAQSAPAWCGTEHFVSFAGQEVLPWRTAWMQEPALELATDVTLDSAGAGPSAWAYLCPLLKAPGQPYFVELCLAEWHGPGATPESPFASTSGRVASCASVLAGGVPSAVDTFVLPFGAGPLATAAAGTAATQTAAVVPRMRFAVQISAAQLRGAIAADNLPRNALHPGAPEAGQGCERGLSTEASAYQLVGIEQGIESRPPGRLTAAQADLQVSTALSGTGAEEGLVPAVAW